MNTVIFIMGVSGCGKSTIGQLLSQRLRIPFFDGDDYHPQSNKDKMKNGVPLNDKDRHGWLITLHDIAAEQLKKNSCIIACSALKASYRDILSAEIKHQVTWVYLTGSFNQIIERINQRNHHFMSPELLQSQFDTLEPPKHALKINISSKPEEIIEKIANKIN